MGRRRSRRRQDAICVARPLRRPPGHRRWRRRVVDLLRARTSDECRQVFRYCPERHDGLNSRCAPAWRRGPSRQRTRNRSVWRGPGGAVASLPAGPGRT